MDDIKTLIFLKKASKIHGDIYDYRFVEYRCCNQPVEIICRLHGKFNQKPYVHLQGKGCFKCGKDRHRLCVRKNSEQFICDARLIHGGKYDYSLVEYVTNRTYVKILCPIHGSFQQWPEKHLVGQGCPQCKGLKTSLSKRLSDQDFLNLARKIHGNTYDYSKMKYVNAKTKIVIICQKHGEFLQTPSNHLYGKYCGCIGCGRKNISNAASSWLDALDIKIREYRIPNTKYIVDGFDPKTNTVYEYYGKFWHGNPKYFPPNDVNPKNKIPYGVLYEKTLKRIERLKDLGYSVCERWE